MIAILNNKNERVYSDDLLIQGMHRTVRVFAKALNTALSPIGFYSSEWTIIKAIKERQGLSQAELASFLDIEPAAISKALTRLEKKDIIYRKQLKNNKSKNIFLTNEANLKYEKLEEVVEKHRNESLKSLSKEERIILKELLEKMYANIKKE